jgi:hypothetical protein
VLETYLYAALSAKFHIIYSYFFASGYAGDSATTRILYDVAIKPQGQDWLAGGEKGPEWAADLPPPNLKKDLPIT